jgi:hypothetical protein
MRQMVKKRERERQEEKKLREQMKRKNYNTEHSTPS